MEFPNLEELSASLRAEDALAHVVEELIPLIRPAIRMVVDEEPIDEEQIPEGTSKLGGQPDFPEGWEWPMATLDIPPPTPKFLQAASQIPHIVLPPPDNKVSLPFVAQIRLSELKELLPANLLPQEGILYFFYNAQTYASDGGPTMVTANNATLGISVSYGVFGLDDGKNFRVLYEPNEEGQRNRQSPPESVPVDHRYAVRAVSFEVIQTLPKVETSFIGDPGDKRGVVVLEEEAWNTYEEVRAEGIPNTDHLLGYSQDAQPYALEASYIKSRSQLFPELPGWNSLSEEEQRREYHSCSLLLQMEAHSNKMWFGRAGSLFFFIRNEDLEQRNFSRVWAWTQ